MPGIGSGRPPSCICGICKKCLYNAQQKAAYKLWTPEQREAKRKYVRKSDSKRKGSPKRVISQKKNSINKIKNQPEAHKAHNAVNYAVKVGKLIRGICEVCGDPKTEAHHYDYSKKLDVRWFCGNHHREEHTRLNG